MTAKSDGFGSVACRLAKNHYDVDEDNSHIHVNQDIARGTGTGKLLVRVCPAHVYSEESDGTISVEYAACLECGTCLAVAAPGSLEWHYPQVQWVSRSEKDEVLVGDCKATWPSLGRRNCGVRAK